MLTGVTTLTQAAVFSDNFDSYATELNWTPTAPSGWTLSNGTVDLISSTNAVSYDFLLGNGGYEDLDSSTNQAGFFSQGLNLTDDIQYILSFDLAGSQRVSTELVVVNFGGVLGNYSLNSGDNFSLKTLNFTPDLSGLYTISFQNQGGYNVGVLLDNVNVAVVPEPKSTV
jgi:hypothetical protein